MDNRNTFGLFDAARRSPEKERATLTQADIERQLGAGPVSDAFRCIVAAP